MANLRQPPGIKKIYDMIEERNNPGPKHSMYSPSGSYHWLNCGRSVQITRRLPEDPGSAASIRGTMYHGYIEKFMLRYSGVAWFNPETLPKLSKKVSKRKLKNSYEDFIKKSKFVKGWMSKNLYTCLMHYTIEVQKDLLPYRLIPTGKGGHTPVCASFYEERVTMDNIIKGCFGTVDYMTITPTCLYVVDYKFGRMRIEPDSDQLLLYAIGAYDNFILKDGEGKKRRGTLSVDFKEICTVIIQPELDKYPSYHRFDLKQLEKYTKDYKNRAEKHNKGRHVKPATLGPWCEYFAKCAPYCDKYKKKNIADTKKLFEKG